MGNKSDRTGKYLPYYLAVSCLIAAFSFASCASMQDTINAMKAHQQLEQYRKDMADGFFETVIEQSEQILAENETAPPADVALYSLGEVYAHADYEGRDYVLSQYYFEELVENFPDSTLSAEAKTYISLFETIAAQEEQAAAIEERLLQKDENTAVEVTGSPQKEIIVVTEKKSEVRKKSAVKNKPEINKKKAVYVPRKVVENKNFAEAIQKNLQLVEELGPQKPADEALYNLGLIYAHVDNPAKDYKKSKLYFHVLTTQFPDSEFAEEAQIWLGLFETLEKIQQIDVDIEQQKKQLTR